MDGTEGRERENSHVRRPTKLYGLEQDFGMLGAFCLGSVTQGLKKFQIQQNGPSYPIPKMYFVIYSEDFVVLILNGKQSLSLLENKILADFLLLANFLS